MDRRLKPLILTFALTALSTIAAYADPKPPIDIKVQVLKEVEIRDATGNVVLTRETLDVAVPNEGVIYKITLNNRGNHVVRDVILNIPISDSIEISPNSFTSDLPARFTFSEDSKTYIAWPAGTAAANTSPSAADIRAVKISLDAVPEGENFFIEYDAVVKK